MSRRRSTRGWTRCSSASPASGRFDSDCAAALFPGWGSGVSDCQRSRGDACVERGTRRRRDLGFDQLHPISASLARGSGVSQQATRGRRLPCNCPHPNPPPQAREGMRRGKGTRARCRTPSFARARIRPYDSSVPLLPRRRRLRGPPVRSSSPGCSSRNALAVRSNHSSAFGVASHRSRASSR